MKIGKQLSKPLTRYQGLRGENLVAAVESALAEVKIASPYRVAQSYPHEISGGERQRVALALALACKPRLLIADEITTSLDVSVQAEILVLLDKIIESRGMGLIFITHDLAVAAQIVNEVVVLQNGLVIESGELRQIIEFLIEKVSKSGGHLGPNLGVVELTLAMHKIFDSPKDVILFDTGHQSYVHKILTGRQEGFDTLRWNRRPGRLPR